MFFYAAALTTLLHVTSPLRSLSRLHFSAKLVSSAARQLLR